MKKNNKSIYHKLDGLKAPINKSQTWEAIYNRDGFPKPKKKRRFLFWYLFGFGILMLVGGLAISNYNNAKQLVEKDDSKSNAITTQNLNNTESIKESNTKPNEGKISKSNTILNETSLKTSSTKKTKKIVRLTTANLGIKLQTNLLEETVGLEHQYDNPSLFKTVQENSISQVNGLQNTSNFALTESEESAGELFFEKTDVLNLQNLKQSLVKKYIERQYPLLPPPPLGQLFYLKEDSKVLDGGEPIKIISSKSAKPWTIEIAAGIGTGRHNISEDSLWRDQAFLNENTESLASYLLSLRISRKFNNNWRIAIGLEFANSRRLFSYESRITQYARLDMPMPHFYTESTEIINYNFYRQHQTLDVESLLIRDFNWNKTTFYVGVGAGVNTVYNFKGKAIDSGGEDFDLNTTAAYRDKLGLHFLYELGISQQLKGPYYISASLSGRTRRDLNESGSHSFAPLYFRLGFGRSLN